MMAEPLRVHLLGDLLLTDARGRPLDLGSPTTRSLFAYLVVHRGQPLERRRLAYAFWPWGTEAAARRNLRQYLHRLRRALDEVAPDLLQATGAYVQLAPDFPLWVDVERFRQLTDAHASLEALRQAVALYRGDLLQDVYEDWVEEPRAELRERYLRTLERLARGYAAQGATAEALTWAQRWVAADALDEAAHRLVMRLYLEMGDRGRALQQYRLLSELLQQELQVAPSPETQALAAELQSAEGARPRLVPVMAPQPRPSEPMGETPHAPLVGREKELAFLEEMLAQAVRGQGHWVLIQGEAGIGKTRLWQEYRQRHPEVPVLAAVCSELEALVPYAPLRHMVKQALALFPPALLDPPPPWLLPLLALAPDLAARYNLPVPGEAPPPDRLGEALYRLLLTLVTALPNGPLHLVLDDLHWSDTPTWELLAQLARRARDVPLLILGLLRLEDLPLPRARMLHLVRRERLLVELPLRRLTPEESAALARSLLPGEEPFPHFFDRLYRETEGNPFFVIEMTRAALEAPKMLAASEGPWLPRTVQQVLQARLSRLPETYREWLGAAAVLGHSFTLPMLRALTQADDEDLVAAIEAWVRRGLVREEALGFTFSHDKIRQVAYQSLSRARRQILHRRVAEVLEAAVPPADAATLAYHYARSDEPLKALPYLTHAGEQALRVRSYHEARQFGEQAIRLLGGLPGPRERAQRVDLNLQLAQAYAFSGDLSRALDILTQTEDLAAHLGDEQRLGQVFYRSAQIFWLRGEPRVAGDYARRTLRVAEETGNPTLLQAALRMLGRVSIATGAFDDAIAYLQRYLRLEHTPPPPQRPVVLGYLGVAYARVGSFARALEAAREGVALAEARGVAEEIAFARMQLGFVHAEARAWQRALEVTAPIPDPLQQDEPLTPGRFMLLGLQGRALAYVGRTQEALQRLTHALAWAEAADYRVFHYLPRLFYAEALALAEAWPQAEREARRALEEAQQAGNRWAYGVALQVLAGILARQPEPPWQQVEMLLIQSMHALRRVRARPDLARTYLALRRLYDRAGQIAWAVDCHFRATSLFEELGMRQELEEAQGRAVRQPSEGGVLSQVALRGPNLPLPAEWDEV